MIFKLTNKYIIHKFTYYKSNFYISFILIIPDIKMSQPELISDLDVPENPQHPCQCSAIGNMDSVRDRTERHVGCTRISNNQDFPRSLETLQSAFEPIRRLESPHQDNSQQISLDNAMNIDLLEHQASISPNSRSMNNQNSMLLLHGHNLSCSPRNLDLSRNLAFEAARRVQETSSLQENQHSLTSTPSPLLEAESNLLETSSKELEDHGGLSPQKQHSSKDKLKNVQQVLNPYQHHHEPAVDRSVHGHFHSDIHAHIHKHTDNFRSNSNLDAAESLMGFQQHQRQHTHHHHGNTKTNVAHHHGSGTHHAHTQGMSGHHHGNLVTNLTSHMHGTSGSLSASGSYLFLCNYYINYYVSKINRMSHCRCRFQFDKSNQLYHSYWTSSSNVNAYHGHDKPRKFATQSSSTWRRP